MLGYPWKGLLLESYIYINLGILPLCTDPLNDTSYMNKAWYKCQVS